MPRPGCSRPEHAVLMRSIRLAQFQIHQTRRALPLTSVLEPNRQVGKGIPVGAASRLRIEATTDKETERGTLVRWPLTFTGPGCAGACFWARVCRAGSVTV